MATIKIDNQDYDTDRLSKDAKAQLANIQASDAEIKRLKMQLAITQTARNAYAKALQELLDSEVGGKTASGKKNLQ